MDDFERKSVESALHIATRLLDQSARTDWPIDCLVSPSDLENLIEELNAALKGAVPIESVLTNNGCTVTDKTMAGDLNVEITEAMVDAGAGIIKREFYSEPADEEDEKGARDAARDIFIAMLRAADRDPGQQETSYSFGLPARRLTFSIGPDNQARVIVTIMPFDIDRPDRKEWI